MKLELREPAVLLILSNVSKLKKTKLQAYRQFQEKLVCLWFNSESRQNIEIYFVCYIEVLWKLKSEIKKKIWFARYWNIEKQKTLQDSLVIYDFMSFA